MLFKLSAKLTHLVHISKPPACIGLVNHDMKKDCRLFRTAHFIATPIFGYFTTQRMLLLFARR
jgi:hypothetical protein